MLALTLAAIVAVHVKAENPAIVEAGWGPFSFNGGLQPKALPRHRLTPVAVGLSGRVTGTTADTPALREITLDLDKNGAVDAAGIPACSWRLVNASTREVMRRCADAQVGTGLAHIELSSQQEPVAARLMLFNGGVRAGTTTAFLRAYVPAPVSAPVIAVAKIRSLDQGPYGLRVITRIPLIEDGAAKLLDFSVVIKRLAGTRKDQRSFAMARCPKGHLNARLTSFRLNEEILDGTTVVRACTPVE
jgi:hypothetical protein